MSPCAGLKLVSDHDEIAPDVVYAIRCNTVHDASDVTVYSRPIYLKPHFGLGHDRSTQSLRYKAGLL